MRLTPLEKNELGSYSPFCIDPKRFACKNILLTGSKGLIGETLIKSLLFLNEAFRLGLHIFASTRNPNKLPSYLDGRDPVTLIPFGLENQVLSDIQLDFVIHSAAPTERRFFIEKPVETIRVIVDETERMLELAKQKQVESFLYLSSVEAYGVPNSDVPISEDYVGMVDQLNIRNGYPVGKKAAEFLCHAYYEEYGVPAKIIRPSSVQGLFQPYAEERVYNQILRCVIEKKDLILNSDGSSKKSIIYPLDLVSALFVVLLEGKNGEAYNATNPATFLSVKDTAEFVFARFSSNLKVGFDIKPLSETGYLPKLCFTQNIDKLAALGWSPRAGLDHIYQVDIERFSK